MNVVPSVNTNVREVRNTTSSHFLNHKKRTMNKAIVFAVVVALVAAGSMLPMVVFTF